MSKYVFLQFSMTFNTKSCFFRNLLQFDRLTRKKQKTLFRQPQSLPKQSARTPHGLCTDFARTLRMKFGYFLPVCVQIGCRTDFARTLHGLCTDFARTLRGLCEARGRKGSSPETLTLFNKFPLIDRNSR